MMKKIILGLALLTGTLALSGCCGSYSGCGDVSSYTTAGCCGDTSW